MGRCYDGDIEGQFWFGIQSSTDGEFFGAKEVHNNYIEYRIENEQKNEVLKAIKKCKTQLGEWLEIFDKYTQTQPLNICTSVSQEKVQNFVRNKKYKINIKDHQAKVMWYARLELGRKMVGFFEKNPDSDLYFNAQI